MMTRNSYTLLLVEDNFGDADLARERLTDFVEFHYELIHVTTLAKAIEAISNRSFDAVILDLNLPDSRGIETLRRLFAVEKTVPVVVLSGTVDEELRTLVLREGAQDFLAKDEPPARFLVRSVLYALERHRAQEQQQNVQLLVSADPDAVIVVDLQGIVRFINQAGLDLFGRTHEDFVGTNFGFAISEGRPAEIVFNRGSETRIGEIWVVRFIWKGAQAYLATIRDVTARKITEMALRHKTSILQCVLDSIGDGVVVADTKGKFLLFNRAAEQILKMGQTDTLPDQWQQRYGLFQPDTVTPIPKDDIPLVRAIKGENVDQAEMVVNRQDLTRPICLSANARPLRDEEGTLLGGVVVIQDITKKKRVETERRKIEESLRLRDRAVQAVSQGIIITDPRQPDNPIIYANQAFEKITGYSMTEVLGRNCRFLHGKDTDQATVSHIREQMRQKQPINVEILNYRKDGSRFWNSLSISPVIGDNGEIVNFVGVQIDVTEHKRLEEGLRQSQKMEAVGQLAGGIAHDFNNLLTVINGYSSLGLTDLPPNDPARTWLEEIHKAGERATALTQQMLVFSRKQIIIPQLLHLNAVVAESGRMLGRLISEDVMLALSLQSRHDRVNADPTQLDQVLMNLAVNARDAMPGGGRLTIETSDVELDQDYVKRYPRVTPGRHVLLAVSDTGCGMAPDVKARIFEPFFTTKGVGKGTGLGLAVVHGIIKEMGGHIEVYSEPGIGTTFKMYLPQAPDTARKTKSKSRELTPPRGAETILLVEDDSSVRTLVCIALAHQGYKVLTARNGIDGLRVAKEFAGPIHLLITDIVMPEMGGRLLWEQFAVLFPQARVLYMSGYTDDAVVRHGILHENVQFLQKPVAIGPLAFKVREVLDHAGAARVLSPLN